MIHLPVTDDAAGGGAGAKQGSAAAAGNTDFLGIQFAVFEFTRHTCI